MVSLTDLPGISDENNLPHNLIVGTFYLLLVLIVIGAALPADDTEQASDDAGADAATDTPAPTEEMTTTVTEAEQTTEEPTETEAPETDPPETKEPNPEEASGDGYQVRVSYDGEWSGAIGKEGTTRSVDGSGTETFDIEGDPFIVSGNAQKQDAGSGELTIQILEEGEVISEQSTTAEYGVASTSSQT